ncbi:MAG: hypothetical protein QXW71_02445 [Thermoplasmata archaeon]
MGQVEKEINIEEIVKLLTSITGELKKTKIDELADIVARLNNLLACLDRYPVPCVIQMEFGTANVVVIEGISEVVSDTTTIAELRNVIKNIIVRNADKVISSILTELRNTIDKIITKTQEEEQDP